MKKINGLLLSLVLLCACHTHKETPQQSLLPSPETQTVSAEQTLTPLPNQEAESAQPPQQKNTQPVPVLPTEPDKKKTPVKEVFPAEEQKQEKQTALSFSSAKNPVNYQPIFKNEMLIDISDRQLHPYADLTPTELSVPKAPWSREQLKYGLYYTGIKVGTAYIRNRGLVSVGGTPAYLLQTTAFSAPVIDTVFKVRDINQSWLAADGSYSLGYGQSVREGNYTRDEWAVFDYDARRYSGQIQKKDTPRRLEGDLSGHVFDMLTSLYYVRTQQLEPGHSIILDIVNREKQYPLLVKVLKKETVKTPAGKFKCVLVEPQIRGEGIFVSKGKSLKVWLTDDEYKMPVKMKVDVFIGSVSAELLEYQRQDRANIL